MISLTENAAKEIRKIMANNDLTKDVAVRVGVKGGGCSGLTYTFDFESQKSRFDLEFESEGLKIIVDKKSNLYVKPRLCSMPLKRMKTSNHHGCN